MLLLLFVIHLIWVLLQNYKVATLELVFVFILLLKITIWYIVFLVSRMDVSQKMIGPRTKKKSADCSAIITVVLKGHKNYVL